MNKLIILLLAVSSIVITFSLNVSEQLEHMVIETYGIGLGIFLTALSLRAFIKFRITRMIFTVVAFGLLTLILCQSIFENLMEVRTISHVDAEQTVEYLVIAAITVFGAGTLFDMDRKK